MRAVSKTKRVRAKQEEAEDMEGSEKIEETRTGDEKSS